MSTLDPRAEDVLLQIEASERRLRGRSLHQRLLPISRRAGLFLNVIARLQGATRLLELGTGAGYAAIWLADAARANNGRLTTVEMRAERVQDAKRNLTTAGLHAWSDVVQAEATAFLKEGRVWDFVLLDLWPRFYAKSLRALSATMPIGSVIIADNVVRPQSARRNIAAYRIALVHAGFAHVTLPLGAGLEFSVRREVTL